MITKLLEPFRQEKLLTKSMLKKVNPNRKTEKARDWVGAIRKLWQYLSVKKAMLLLVMLMIFASSFLGLLAPVVIGFAIDHFIAIQSVDGIGKVLFWLFVIFAGHTITLVLQNYWMIEIAQSTVYNMKIDLFSKLHYLPISFFDKKQYGELMSRVTNDMENISATLNNSFIQILSSIVILIGTLSVMIYLSPILTFITMLVIPLMFFGMKWITKRTRILFKTQQRNLGSMNGFIEETISGQKIIQAFSQEDRVIEEFEEKNKQLRASGFWAQTYSGYIPKLMNVLNNASFALIACIGGLLAILGIGGVTIGMIVIFVEYSRQFTRPLNDLSNQFNTLLSALAGAERVFEIMEETEENRENEKLALHDVKGDVKFSGVSFSYDDDKVVLRDINFEAKAGETIALVGPTGAGKTTVINLLSRFYEHQSGQITIDGIDIETIERGSLRDKIGFVLQDAFLFKGTIMENIRYGRLDATDEEVIEAAKLANAHSFIVDLPNQYETMLGQDGAGISQGQKQLISIARVILKNPALLVLDEATSNIDTVTEIKIQDAMYKIMTNRTSFVIAHRLNTIKNADRILVFRDGTIIESGTHEALLEKQGVYYQLYESQFLANSFA